MARDSKQVFRFIQQNFALANLMQVNNYGMGATPSSGAVFFQTTIGSASHWYHGFSQTINRSGFRDTNADQSILVSGETSAIANDPALFGNTNGAERYVHALVSTYGVMSTTNWEVFLQGATDTGVGTAGTDWTQISGSVALVSQVDNNIPSTGTSVSAGIMTTSAAHQLSVGDVIVPRSANGTIVAYEPLIVVSIPTATTAGLARIAGGVVLTTLTGSGIVYSRPTTRRVVSIPVGPSTKPWVRVVVRAIAPAGGQVPLNTGAWVDQVFLTMGRDSASVG
jgi:hypothetical protein